MVRAVAACNASPSMESQRQLASWLLPLLTGCWHSRPALLERPYRR